MYKDIMPLVKLRDFIVLILMLLWICTTSFAIFTYVIFKFNIDERLLLLSIIIVTMAITTIHVISIQKIDNMIRKMSEKK